MHGFAEGAPPGRVGLHDDAAAVGEEVAGVRVGGAGGVDCGAFFEEGGDDAGGGEEDPGVGGDAEGEPVLS